MRTVTATATIREDHTLIVQVPEDIPPGRRTVVVVLEEAVPMIRPRSLHLAAHPTGPVDAAGTYRREDIYGDDDR